MDKQGGGVHPLSEGPIILPPRHWIQREVGERWKEIESARAPLILLPPTHPIWLPPHPTIVGLLQFREKLVPK